MRKVLFVCTGNVFRSMTAEKTLGDFLRRSGIADVAVDSAGIAVIPDQPIFPAVIERLGSHAISVAEHRPKQVTPELVAESDLVIAMNVNHREYLKANFGIEAPLYNEVAFGRAQGILDFSEYDPSFADPYAPSRSSAACEYARGVVDYLYRSAPVLWSKLSERL